MPATRLSGRVVKRLTQAEACETNAHYRDDLQIARLTVHYAATGEAVLCPPDVLASYAVLGLHPEKVWPAIEARRKALLGPLLEVLGAPPVPKKAAQSVKLWAEQTNGARAVNSRPAMQNGSPRTISVPMAATPIAAAYPNSDRTGSAKDRPFFKREELQEFFETCPADLVSYPELRTVRGMWVAAGKPFGSEIQFFKAIKHYCQGALYRSESTVRSNIRRAEDSGVLEVAYRNHRGSCHHIWIRQRSEADRGLYRRVTTHRLSIPLLMQWRHRKGLDSQSKVEPIRKPAQPAPKPDPPATEAPRPETRERPAAQAREERQHSRRITRDERTALFSSYIALKRSGMPHAKAIAEVQRQFQSRYSPEDIEFAVKIIGHKETGRDVTLDSAAAETRESHASAKCQKCGSALVQNSGPGPRLKCLQCSPDSS